MLTLLFAHACSTMSPSPKAARRWRSFAAACAIGIALAAPAFHAQTLQLQRVTVITSPQATAPEQAAAQLLLDEANRRTGLGWTLARTGDDCLLQTSDAITCIVLSRSTRTSALLPAPLRTQWLAVAPSHATAAQREGFTVETLHHGARTILVIAGNDSRGVLYGVGYVLRHLAMRPGSATLSAPLHAHDAPEDSVRSHQIGYRYKNNTYDAWTLPMFEQQARDLAVFGISGLQFIAPDSDDRASSPLYPAPALPTLIGLSRIMAKYGLDCDLYYPEMQKDYTQPGAVESEVQKFTALVGAMPEVNALYVPGGDPGHTSPDVLLPLVEREAAALQRIHPGATVWVSAQGFDRAEFESFYRYLHDKQPRWLTGVFFGPQSRDSFEVQRARIPRRYRMLFYPDIGHTMHAQFPVPQWDPIFAMTEGREPIDPRPVDETHIYRHFAALNTGFVTYSEGVNDDVNKFLWTRLGWHSDADPHETLREYARYFLGDKTDRFADALFELEQDWRGLLRSNAQIPQTLAHLREIADTLPPNQRENWRLESALYRATYDNYLQQRLRVDTSAETAAYAALDHADTTGALTAMTTAEAALQVKSNDPATQSVDALHAQLYALAAKLWDHARLQLSVKLYGASGIERGANLDRVDTPLNDRIWLGQHFADIRQLPTETARLTALSNLRNDGPTPPGTLYDDLGEPSAEPHLMRGEGFERDPEFYQTAIDGVADETTSDGWRLADISYAETLYETPLHLRYTGLAPGAAYTLRITYAGEGYTLPITLRAGEHTLIHGPRLRKSNPETVEFPVPAGAVQQGRLDLYWTRPDGIGGGGRGKQVARVWLIPTAHP